MGKSEDNLPDPITFVPVNPEFVYLFPLSAHGVSRTAAESGDIAKDSPASMTERLLDRSDGSIRRHNLIIFKRVKDVLRAVAAGITTLPNGILNFHDMNHGMPNFDQYLLPMIPVRDVRDFAFDSLQRAHLVAPCKTVRVAEIVIACCSRFSGRWSHDKVLFRMKVLGMPANLHSRFSPVSCMETPCRTFNQKNRSIQREASAYFRHTENLTYDGV
ncbi:hypothetical protein B0O80DRAFT_460671 [Mortierella sp. GBAus27b]|nr:hypothetical protein B0O80DRAFT_460671 [Mortierella sp. GBAus27b]